MAIKIEKGQAADLPEVLALIKELALFEKAPEQVITTVDSMEKDGFGDRPVFEFFIARDRQKTAGIALYFYGYSTWKGKMIYLDDLVVTESYRKKGIGMQLFKAVVREGVKQQAQLMKWQVLDWNTPAIEFYKQLNADLEAEWLNGRLEHGAMTKLLTQ